jgi:hypothetical protein
MRKGVIKASLERLEGCTKRIDTWVERAGKYQGELVIHRSKLNFTDSLGAIQENASRIYCALSEGWCKIKSQHPTFLLLEQRLKRPRHRRKWHQGSVFNMTSESTCFKLSINGECCPLSQQFNTEIRVVETPPRYDNVTCANTASRLNPYANFT